MTDYLRLDVVYDATVGLQLRALWSEVLAFLTNCCQKIAISPQVMFANVWHHKRSQGGGGGPGGPGPPPPIKIPLTTKNYDNIA